MTLGTKLAAPLRWAARRAVEWKLRELRAYHRQLGALASGPERMTLTRLTELKKMQRELAEQIAMLEKHKR